MNKIFTHVICSLFLILFLNQPVSAIDYELPDLNGQMQSLNQYKGKWLVVNYWATWCGTCIKELPDLISLHEDNKAADIVVVGINFESINQERLMAFVSEHSISYPVLRTEPVPMTPLGSMPALPVTYIIDPKGEIVAGQVGIVTQKNLEEFINAKKASQDYVETSLQQDSDVQG